jgi:hypothetical protein
LGRHGIKINRDQLIDQLQSIVEGSEPRFIEAVATPEGTLIPRSRPRSGA